jgi:hypothetical protein
MVPVALALALLGSAPKRPSAAPTEPHAPPDPGIMYPDPPMGAKDFAFIKEGDYFHVFWMRRDASVPWDSTERDLGHAVSRDLREWTQLDPVLPARPGKWDDLHIWAPTILKRNGTFYMYYTGVTQVPYLWNAYQRIGLATSTDLLQWTRYDEPVLSAAMIPWALSDSSRFEGCQFRDPFAMPDPVVPERTLLYYVSTPAADPTQLLVGAARSDDMRGFTGFTPLWGTGASRGWGWCESPHVFEHGGLYYLFASAALDSCVRFRTSADPLADSSGWSGEHVLASLTEAPFANHWIASEFLRTPGHDYLAVVNAFWFRLEFYEIAWDTTGPGFSLVTPVVPDPPVPVLGLSAIPRAGSGTGVLFRASMPQEGEARVDLYDVGGRRVRVLFSGTLHAGETVVPWDGRSGGGPARPGVYFAALTFAGSRRVARVSLTR